MKDNRKEKKTTKEMKKEKQPKASFASWYGEERRTFKGWVLNLLYHLLILVICVVGSYMTSLYLFGDAINLYSDQTFEELSAHISNCFDENVGIDILSLTDKEQITHYNISDVDYVGNNGEQVSHILTCSKENGYFKAIIKVELNSNFGLISASQNYSSMAQYQQQYHRDFGILMLGIAVAIYLVIRGVIYGGLELIYYISRRSSKTTSSGVENIPAKGEVVEEKA